MENLNVRNFEEFLSLCNLEIGIADIDRKAREVEFILEWVNLLSEVNVENTVPLTHLHTEEATILDDNPGKALSHADVLCNAPSKNANYIVIPRLL